MLQRCYQSIDHQLNKAHPKNDEVVKKNLSHRLEIYLEDNTIDTYLKPSLRVSITMLFKIIFLRIKVPHTKFIIDNKS